MRQGGENRKGGEGAGGTIHPMGIFRKNAENQGESLISGGESLISGKPRPIYRKWWFWVLATPLVLFIALVIYRIPFVIEKDKTAQAVAQIHAQKLTINDVNGEHLPPPPDPAQADATIEGIDANANGIRDDVELAIFKKYPDSARIRAAELQYAKGLQLQFTKVFSTGTFVAAIQEDGRGYSCILETEPDHYPDFSKELADQNKRIDDRLDEVENLVMNTNERKSMYENNYDKYMTSFATLQEQNCDLDVKAFSD